MEESVNKLDGFISKLVEFSKTSNQPVAIERVDLGKMVKAILDGLKRHANADHIKVECSMSESTVVHSDFHKILTALTHTIRNAFDFIDLSKCSGIILIKVEVNNQSAMIEVMDNGIGIDRRCIPTIFQMFYRASNLSKGSGLGLYLAREAVVKLHGTIEVSSEVNLGTVVTIRIPNEVGQAYDDERELKIACNL
jgi:signal transduction histidine kinase